MKYDRLYNFISPVTGKLPIDRGYTLLGDKDGRSFASPILIDVRQDIIDLKRKIGNFEELKKLDHNRIWIGDYTNEPVEQLHIGIINLPPLAEAVFPSPISSITGDLRIPNPTFDYLSPFDWVMSGPFLPQIFATKYDALGNPTGTDVSSSLAMTQVRAAQIMKRFDNANFIVGSSVVDFAWENPKMYLIPETLKQLYGLGTTYTFTKAQSLGNLQTGLLKNTVNNATGTLSTAIAGVDYVDFAKFSFGPLVVRPLVNSKFIASTGFSTKGNEPNEFGYPIPNTIPILIGTASKFDKLALTSLENNVLVKSNNGELVKAVVGIDYIDPSSLQEIIKNLTATTVVVKNIIGVPQTTDITTIKEEDSSLATAVKYAVGVEAAVKIADLVVTTSNSMANKAALLEIEAQIAALAGVQTITTLGTILGFLGLTASGKAYGDYIRGQSLNIKNTYKSADLNDEGHNAVGDFEFRFPSGYSSDDRGFSTLWFDSNSRNSADSSSAGLRLFAWDSGGDHLGYDSPLAPLHIGIFGYQNKYNIAPIPNPTPIYKGFIFESEFNDDKNSDSYRFPKKFGLYDVKRTISTLFTQRWGWDSKERVFEYDYVNFNFYKKVILKEYSIFEKEVDFFKNVSFLSTGAMKIPTGNVGERPTESVNGMIRYNTDPNIKNFEGFIEGVWKQIGSSGTVTSINAIGSKGIFISGAPITTSGTLTYTLSQELQALSDFSGIGYVVRTGASTYISNQIVGGSGITVTNGNGINGNTSIAVSNIPINSLANYPNNSVIFLNGAGVWSLVDINTSTTGSLNTARLTGFPNNSSVFLNGAGLWSSPIIPNIKLPYSITESVLDNVFFNLNHTNSTSIAIGYSVTNSTSNKEVRFGLSSNNSECYVWTPSSIKLSLATNNQQRLTISSNGSINCYSNNISTTGLILTNNLASNTTTSIMVSSPIDMVNNEIRGLSTPTNASSATNKTYVDSKTDKYQTVSYSSNISWDTTIGNVSILTLTGNCTLNSISWNTQGRNELILLVKQDSTGNRTLNIYGIYRPNSTTSLIPLTTAANAIDCLIFKVFNDGRIYLTQIINNFQYVAFQPVKYIFNYTGNIQTVTIPTSPNSYCKIRILAGGGGQGVYSTGGSSGAGGYNEYEFYTQNYVGQTLYVIVGQGGEGGISGVRAGAGGYPNGGRGISGDTYPGGGGGRSEVRIGSSSGTILVIAGGGGGGSGYSISNVGAGGGGDRLNGQDGASVGTGGTISSGGLSASGQPSSFIQAGFLQGAGATTNLTGQAYDCGGGGDGYYGGGCSGGDGRVSGGGSGYNNDAFGPKPPITIEARASVGTSISVDASTNPDFSGGYGVGWVGSGSGTGLRGGNGRVVIEFS